MGNMGLYATVSLFALILLTSGGCASSGGPLLSKTQFALTQVLGKRFICASAVRTSCGLSLSDCSEGLLLECATDVIIIDVGVKQVLPAPPPQPEEI